MWSMCVALAALQLTTGAGYGQNYTGDARKIGMGIGMSDQNIASDMMKDSQPYSTIAIPVGLIQLVRNRHKFDPTDDSFNPIQLIEDISNPLHYTPHRESAGSRLVNDLVNAGLSRNLNTYRGFVPAREIRAQGLASPSFGHTFRLIGNNDETSHGVYVGAGPYLAIGTEFNLDQQLLNLLSSKQDVFLPNASLRIRNNSAGQAAFAITTGYRG